MKIIIDNQSRLDDMDAFDVVHGIFHREQDYINQNPSGCHFRSKHLQNVVNVWQDSEGLNFRITDLKGK